MNIKKIIKQCITEVLAENYIHDPTKEEMMEYLRSQFGNEEEFEAEAAIYWFANHYHGGQSSNLYSVLSTSEFSPGPISRGPEPGSMEEMMYQELESKFGNSNNPQNSDDGEYSHSPEMRVRSDEPTNELEENDKQDCQQCKGEGHYFKNLKDRSGKNNNGMGNDHIVPCDATGCNNGKVDRDKYYKTWDLNEAGTKFTEGFDPWSNGAGANLDSYESQNAKMRKMEEVGTQQSGGVQEDLGSDTDVKVKVEEIQHHCSDCGKDVSHPSKPGSCTVLCQDCLEVSQHLVKEGIELEGMEIENNTNYSSCKGCGRVTDKGQDKCPKCRETKDTTSLPPKRMPRGAKRPADAYGNFNEETIGTSNPLEGKSNVAATSFVNKVLAELSRGLFSDNSWEQIHKIFNKLKELGLDVELISAKYGGQGDTSNGMPKYKEWQISIPFTNNKGRPTKLVGQITAHGAGSVEQPLDKYDITAYVNAIAIK